MGSFWASLKEAFDEGRDEGAHGAPTALLIEVMMLAARADRHVTKEEMHRVAALLGRHFHAFGAASEADLMNELYTAVTRLDARGDRDEQLRTVAAALRGCGPFGAEKGYALAFAVLLADAGLNERERAFTDRLAEELGVGAARRSEIEADLEQALRGD
jgi:uncharacterized membrane protein YebE (DUF533 family)